MRVNFQIRSRSAVLVEAARRLGTSRALAGRLGIDVSMMSALMNFREKPAGRLLERRIEVEIILSEILGRPVEFDEAFLPWKLRTNVIEREADIPLPMLEPPKTPEDLLLEGEHVEEIEKMVSTLSRPEQDVLRARFGLDDGEPKLMREIAAKGLAGPNVHSVERVRQLHDAAVHHLRGRLNRHRSGEKARLLVARTKARQERDEEQRKAEEEAARQRVAAEVAGLTKRDRVRAWRLKYHPEAQEP